MEMSSLSRLFGRGRLLLYSNISNSRRNEIGFWVIRIIHKYLHEFMQLYKFINYCDKTARSRIVVYEKRFLRKHYRYRTQEGDHITNKTEFERIARKYTNTIYAHALVILGNKADAEDAAEEAIYKLLVRKLPFRDDEHVKAWLIRVVINESIMMLRKRKKLSGEELTEDNAGCTEFQYPEQSEIFDAVNSLDLIYRSVLLLYYCVNMSVCETARMLGISKSAVTTRLQRARQLLKEELERRNFNG